MFNSLYRILTACVNVIRVKECSRQVSDLCRSLKDSIIWRVRNSTGEYVNRSQYGHNTLGANIDDTERMLKTRGGSHSAPNELAEHVSVLRGTENILSERVLCARDSIQGSFQEYVKIHRGFRENRRSITEIESTSSRVSTAVPQDDAAALFGADSFFPTSGVDSDFIDGFQKASPNNINADKHEMDGTRASQSGDPPILAVLPSISAVASMQVRTARDRRSLRGKHIENKGIEKCGDDVLRHCADEGKLAHLKALKSGLESHVLYQEAVLLVARNVLLTQKSIKTEVKSDIGAESTTSTLANGSLESLAGCESPEQHGVTVTDPDEFAPLSSLLSRIPSAPPHASESIMKLQKIRDGGNIETVGRHGKKRESGILVEDNSRDTAADDYLNTGMEYAYEVLYFLFN